jgi:outer membrane protein OmpA-like peptidoglycan-associated protein
VLFPFGGTNLDAEATRVLDVVAAAMQANPDVLVVELRGSYSTIEPARLAKERADVVHAELVKRGIDATRLQVVDDGEGNAATRALERDVWVRVDKQRYWLGNGTQECTPIGEVYRPCRR